MSNPDRYLDDVAEGEVAEGGPIAITAEAIMAFGQIYDPQPFHTDPAAAKASPFGGLIASGWHIAALVMKDWAESRPYGSVPLIGMAIDELRWLAPVRPGDALTIRREVLAVRRSATKPDRGTLRSLTEVKNQDGVLVLRFIATTRMPVRS